MLTDGRFWFGIVVGLALCYGWQRYRAGTLPFKFGNGGTK